jgi:hypothetical protein
VLPLVTNKKLPLQFVHILNSEKVENVQLPAFNAMILLPNFDHCAFPALYAKPMLKMLLFLSWGRQHNKGH